jgi:hypothetical protein
MPQEKKINVRRPEVVKVTLTDREKLKLQVAANAASMPLSIYVRVAALEKAQK